MSTFSDAMGTAWNSAVAVFGDTIIIGGGITAYNCVVHDLQYSTEVAPGRPGRSAILSGTVVMRAIDWNSAAGTKGIKVTVGSASARVINDPNIGYTSGEVTLVLGPRT